MRRHLLSFLRSPIGYMANFVGTATAAFGLDRWSWLESLCCWLCNNFCLNDGIQDDWHPLLPPYK